MQRSRTTVLLLVLWVGSTSLADEKKPVPKPPLKSKPGKLVALFDGKSLANWRVIKKFDFEKHGAITVKKGAIVMSKGSPATGLSWDGKFAFPRTNYEVSLDAARLAGDDFFCGMTFPVGESYLTLILGGWGGGVTGISNLDNLPAVENETTDYTEFKQGQWYHVRLRVTPEKVEAWVDKKQIVDIETKDRKLSIWWEQEPVCPFGVASWYTTSSLKNIQLKRVHPGKARPAADDKE